MRPAWIAAGAAGLAAAFYLGTIVGEEMERESFMAGWSFMANPSSPEVGWSSALTATGPKPGAFVWRESK